MKTMINLTRQAFQLASRRSASHLPVYTTGQVKLKKNSHYRQLRTTSRGPKDEQSEGNLPRRAMIYVPGSDLRKLAKLSSLHVDCAVMDCEDGVAANQKVANQDSNTPVEDLRNYSGTVFV